MQLRMACPWSEKSVGHGHDYDYGHDHGHGYGYDHGYDSMRSPSVGTLRSSSPHGQYATWHWPATQVKWAQALPPSGHS